ncbi:multiple sugar transport system substrate-binding protein [Kribbella amoyensis]|uniref:Multiple sugar transport system substrate-binding protein n=1 Tax=Kribbella amoyensis TaxID=996641 RepID=A0A561BUM2_9ACTN|nr:extracellular solute-binding protein [Kribbella amoyensis]TWD82548.1 multiple sugar transport system substrate-binding protein [Kribbella amoyensis]
MTSINGTQFSRRSLLRFGAAAAGVAAVSSCARGLGGGDKSSSGGSDAALDMMFWGEGDQNKKLIAALDLYQQSEGAAKVNPQYSGFSGYYDKLATRVAGGNPPDVFQIHLPYLMEYIKRGAVAPLDEYKDDLGLDSMPDYVATTTKADGKYYFALLGAATQPAIIVNTTKLKGLGLVAPSTDWNLDRYKATMAEVWDKSGRKLAGTADLGGNAIAFESFLRGRGKALFADGSSLGFGEDDLAAWVQLWQDLRGSGAAVPMALTAASTGFQNDPVTVGKAAYTGTATSRGLPSMQSLTKDTLSLGTFPSGGPGSEPGTNIIPAGWFAISPKSKNIEGAVSMLKYLTSQPDAANAMGLARGVPIPADIRTKVASSATGLNKLVLDNYALVASKGPAALQMYPPGASKLLQTSLPNVNEVVGFGRSTVPQAVTKFFSDAKAALK